MPVPKAHVTVAGLKSVSAVFTVDQPSASEPVSMWAGCLWYVVPPSTSVLHELVVH